VNRSRAVTVTDVRIPFEKVIGSRPKPDPVAVLDYPSR